MNQYFAELIGAFVGDGWMSKTNSGTSLFISGNPKDEKPYYDERIKFLFNKIFKIEIKPRHFEYWGTYGCYVGKKEVISKFVNAGLPIGSKSIIVKVPNQIIKNKKLYKPFIRGLFDTDGSIYFSKSYNKNASKWQKEKHHIPIAAISTSSEKLAKDTLKMLKSLKFKYSYRICKSKKGYHPSHKLEIEGTKNVKLFFKQIKPKNKKHNDKFEEWLTQGFYCIPREFNI
jgi:intein/homing endonuclease